MKFVFALLTASALAAVMPTVCVLAEYHSGDVWGTWTKANSPHIIIADVRVAPGQSLTIDPGCQVLFRGYYKFVADSAAVLHAVGTVDDSILFDEETPGTYWHGIRFLKASSASVISYARLQHGRATGTRPPQDSEGGAVYCSHSSPTLSHNTFTANWSECGGGAVFCDTASHATIVGNLFYADTAYGFGGGGIYCVMSNVTITDNIFDSILGRSGGGAIHVLYYSPTIRNNIFTSNVGGTGGAISCGTNAVYPSYPVVTNNLFSGNLGGYGGAFDCNGGHPTLSGNVFVGNESGHGGALTVENAGSVSLSRCVFVGNYAPGVCGYGGAIYGYQGFGIVENCTFYGNRADAYGGAIAGLSYSAFTISNSIFWGDSAPVGPEFYLGPFTVTYSDVAGGWTGEGNIDMDPLFVGVLDSVQLQRGSPCIDAGDPASPLDPDCTRADIGAYYYDQGTGPRRPQLPPAALRKSDRSGPRVPEH